MHRVSKYLAFASVLNLGAFAQIIVSPPPEGYQQPRIVTREGFRVQGKNPSVSAIALNVQGSCKYSVDGKKFRDLKKDAELPKRAIVRTGSSGNTELFIKRMGATIRIEPSSEVSIERLQPPTKQSERQELNTKVNVRKGKAVTVVHANVPGSSLDVKNAGGKSLTDPVLGSRYEISADSIKDAGPAPAPANPADESTAKMAAAIKEQMEFDELQALAETWRDDENPGLER